MPDLTLYRKDVELIREGLLKAVVDCSTQRYLEYSRLRDLLYDRLVQNLHPERGAEVEGEVELKL